MIKDLLNNVAFSTAMYYLGILKYQTLVITENSTEHCLLISVFTS